MNEKGTILDKMSPMTRDKYIKDHNQVISDFKACFNTPTGKRVLEHLYNKVVRETSDCLNPYAVMRKDACINLIEVYIKQTMLNQKEIDYDRK